MPKLPVSGDNQNSTDTLSITNDDCFNKQNLQYYLEENSQQLHKRTLLWLFDMLGPCLFKENGCV
ncbi:hypothetical protein ANN_07979, partial [Periplaneta americana]